MHFFKNKKKVLAYVRKFSYICIVSLFKFNESSFMSEANIDEIYKLNLTDKEILVLITFINELYAEPCFSDVGVNEISKNSGLSKNVVKGVCGSLCKKGIIYDDDEFDGIFYLHNEYFYLHNRWYQEVLESYVENKSNYYTKTMIRPQDL